MIDTHTHLYLSEFEPDGGGEAAVRRAIDAGVETLIFPNVDLDSIDPLAKLAAKFPENIRIAKGLHPTEVKADWQTVLNEILAYKELPSPPVAIGEIGIDLYWDKTFRSEQMDAFDYQCSLAQDRDLPVIIHCRDGLDEVLEVLGGHGGLRGVFHSFGGTPKDVARIRKTGDFYFGINGIVTFKNSKLDITLPSIGLDRIVLETDSPYLAPVPHRGKRNESSYIPLIAAKIAEVLNADKAVVTAATTANAQALFGL